MSPFCLLVFLISAINNADFQMNSDKHDPELIFFPGETNYREVYNGRNIKTIDNRAGIEDDMIPLDFIQKLNDIEDISDVINKYVEGDVSDFNNFQLANRFGPSERSAVQIPKPAKCMPVLQTVQLKASNDSSMFYIPSCTRVQRCGGCCSHSLLSCQPTLTETLSFQVMVTQYGGGSKLSLRGKEVVLVEQHVKCRCDCIVKKEDCNVFQEYKKEECRCICTNLDEKRKCENSNNKLWDPKICKCRCRETIECTTGLAFDQNKCTCVRIPVRRRFAEINSSKERPFTNEERYDVDIIE